MKPPTMTAAERELVQEAIQQLQDITYIGTASAADAGLRDTGAMEQVTETREAVGAAMKAITTFRARVVRSG